MTDENEEEGVGAGAALLAIMMAYAPPKVQGAVSSIIEDTIFPWYALATGRQPKSNKGMRKEVSEKIEQSLCKTIWHYNGPEVEEDEIVEDMIVASVWAQSSTNGHYDLMVKLVHKNGRDCDHIISLQELMHDFKPVGDITFSDYDA